MKTLLSLIIGILLNVLFYNDETKQGYFLTALSAVFIGYSIGRFIAMLNFIAIKKIFKISKLELMMIIIAFLVAFVYPLFDVYAIMKPYYSNAQITIGVILVYTGFLLWYFLLKAIVKYLSKKV